MNTEIDSPEYYSRNGMACIRALVDSRDNTLSLLMTGWERRSHYWVWHGCHQTTGETPYPELTKSFSRKSDALKYLKTFGDKE